MRSGETPNVANEPRAAATGSHKRSGASAPFACWTAVRLSLLRSSPPRVHELPIHPPSGASPDRIAELETMTFPTCGRLIPAESEQAGWSMTCGPSRREEPDRRCLHDEPIGTLHSAPLSERATTHAPDTNVLHTTQMVALVPIRSFVRDRSSFIRPSNDPR